MILFRRLVASTVLQSGAAGKGFLGDQLLSLLGLVFSLPRGAQTDLLNTMDR